MITKLMMKNKVIKYQREKFQWLGIKVTDKKLKNYLIDVIDFVKKITISLHYDLPKNSLFLKTIKLN